MPTVIGIDPGKSGGIAILSDLGLTVYPMIADAVVVHNLFREIKPSLCVIEHAQAMPGQGVTGMFNYGLNFGALKAICSINCARVELVKPQKWMRAMHCGADINTPTKVRSWQSALKYFPGTDFLATKRSKKPHMGMVEAALIALYGAQVILGGG